MLTGDGGWVGLDKGVAKALVEAGVPVVGLDSLKYFWRGKPAQVAADVARIVGTTASPGARTRSSSIGYSRGADIVPLLPPLMPPEARAALALVAMLGPRPSRSSRCTWRTSSRPHAGARPSRPRGRSRRSGGR